MAARQPAKKTTVPEGAIAVADLPDNKAAQVSEAMKESIPFVMKDGTIYKFKPLADWSYRANKAFAVGDFEAWAAGALEDSTKAEGFFDHGSVEIGRIIRYYDEMAGATRGEGSSSSRS